MGLVLSPPAGLAPEPADTVLGAAEPAQAALPLASAGVQRWLWQGRFGAMLIEVAGDEIYVNGQRVEPHAG